MLFLQKRANNSPDFRNAGSVGALELRGVTIIGRAVHLILTARTVPHFVALSVRCDTKGAAVGAAGRTLELVLEALVAVAVRLVVALGATVRVTVADLRGVQADRGAGVGALELA